MKEAFEAGSQVLASSHCQLRSPRSRQARLSEASECTATREWAPDFYYKRLQILTVPNGWRLQTQGVLVEPTERGTTMLALRLSLACVLSTLLLGIVVANIIDDVRPPKQPEPAHWTTTTFKNPH
jgi:hypothetical protein